MGVKKNFTKNIWEKKPAGALMLTEMLAIASIRNDLKTELKNY